MDQQVDCKTQHKVCFKDEPKIHTDFSDLARTTEIPVFFSIADLIPFSEYEKYSKNQNNQTS